ncbi:hypothetical protein J6590_073428 [Homalodisca vitripennis]|nr:hypothetical protein J6590_073428 [Homalodisca vitripennis]
MRKRGAQTNNEICNKKTAKMASRISEELKPIMESATRKQQGRLAGVNMWKVMVPRPFYIFALSKRGAQTNMESATRKQQGRLAVVNHVESDVPLDRLLLQSPLLCMAIKGDRE